MNMANNNTNIIFICIIIFVIDGGILLSLIGTIKEYRSFLYRLRKNIVNDVDKYEILESIDGQLNKSVR